MKGFVCMKKMFFAKKKDVQNIDEVEKNQEEIPVIEEFDEEKYSQLISENSIEEDCLSDLYFLVKKYFEEGFELVDGFNLVLQKYPSFVKKDVAPLNTGRKIVGISVDINGVEQEFVKRNPDVKKYI